MRPRGPYNDNPKPGGVVRADWIRGIPSKTLDNVVPGRGVTTTKFNEHLLIDARGRGRGAGGGLVIEPVPTLPPLPASGFRAVFWYGDDEDEGGTGDYQIWWAYAGQDRYYPGQAWTNKSGIPVGI